MTDQMQTIQPKRKPGRPKVPKANTQAIAITEPETITPPNNSLVMLQTIERLATNKDANPAIIEMLLREMHALRAEQARREFDAALARAQMRLPIIERHGKIEIRAKGTSGERDGKLLQSTKYALYEDIIEHVLPIIGAEGIAVTNISDTKDKVHVETILSGYGHERRTSVTLMHDSTGSKNSVQAIVSSISYAKRINLCALLSVATRGEDDDGASAGPPIIEGGEPINAEQRAQIVELSTAVGCPGPHLLKHLKVDSLDNLPAPRFDEAIAALRSYAENKRKREESK